MFEYSFKNKGIPKISYKFYKRKQSMHRQNQTSDPTHPHQIDNMTFNQATQILRGFVDQRNWHKFHTPRNLILALTGEVGELAQIFQWKGEVKPALQGFSESQKTHVAEQISDVLAYLLRFSDVCGINISRALQDKMDKNRKKYPTSQFNGANDEFDRYLTKKYESRKNK